MSWTKSRVLEWLLPGLWLVVVVAGYSVLERYKALPGAVGTTPVHAAGTGSGTALFDRPQLKMFIHPRCPCTQASLRELAKLVEHSPIPLDVGVVVVEPAGAPADWEQSPLVTAAASMSGVHVTLDRGSDEARRYGAKTSGHVVLYDRLGSLVFSGGITPSRGHEGDNPGSQSIQAYLRHGLTTPAAAAVYGCPMISTKACCTAGPDASREPGREALP